MPEEPKRKGWFIIDGVQRGDRTIDEQWQGLDELVPLVQGATVLDLGCAEGLIAKRIAEAGAGLVHGVEIVAANAAEARRQCEGLPVGIVEGDLRNWPILKMQIAPVYDVVLALSSLHKVGHPDVLLAGAASVAAQWLVIRLPSRVLRHSRQAFKPYDIPALLADQFVLEMEPPTCRGEWLGYFRRRLA